MKKELKQKWVKALRSGKYTQSSNSLRNKENVAGKDGFCCIGVLCDIIDPDKWKLNDKKEDRPFYTWSNQGEDCFKDARLRKIGMSVEFQASLMTMNDDRGENFLAIADFIEGHDETDKTYQEV